MEEQPQAAEGELADLEVFYRAAKGRFDASPEFAAAPANWWWRCRRAMPTAGSGSDSTPSPCPTARGLRSPQRQADPADVKGESAYNDDLARWWPIWTPPVCSPRATAPVASSSTNSRTPRAIRCGDRAEGRRWLISIPPPTWPPCAIAAASCTPIARSTSSISAGPALPDGLRVARRAGFVDAAMDLEHMGFGTMNGADGRPFKTRDGGTVKLVDLLDEAEERAYQLVKGAQCRSRRAWRSAFSEDELRHIGRVVGIASVKYADLSKHRTATTASTSNRCSASRANHRALYCCMPTPASPACCARPSRTTRRQHPPGRAPGAGLGGRSGAIRRDPRQRCRQGHPAPAVQLPL